MVKIWRQTIEKNSFPKGRNVGLLSSKFIDLFYPACIFHRRSGADPLASAVVLIKVLLFVIIIKVLLFLIKVLLVGHLASAVVLIKVLLHQWANAVECW